MEREIIEWNAVNTHAEEPRNLTDVAEVIAGIAEGGKSPRVCNPCHDAPLVGLYHRLNPLCQTILAAKPEQ